MIRSGRTIRHDAQNPVPAHAVVGALRRSFARFGLLAPVLLLSSCSGQAGGRGFQMPPTPVEIASVAPQVVRDQFTALGSVDSEDAIDVVSEISGTVVELPFTEGQAVPSGHLLARLDDDEISAQKPNAIAHSPITSGRNSSSTATRSRRRSSRTRAPPCGWRKPTCSSRARAWPGRASAPRSRDSSGAVASRSGRT